MSNASVASSGLPAPGAEHWQYADVRALLRRAELAPMAAGPPRALPAALTAGDVLHVHDGRVAGGSLASALLPLAAGAPLVDDPELRLQQLPAAARAVMQQLQLAGRRQLEIIYSYSGAAGAACSRLRLQLAAGAHVTLVERHVGNVPKDALACIDLGAALADGSRLEHYRLLDLQGPALRFEQLAFRLAAGAHYVALQVGAQAGSTRTTQVVQLAGPGSGMECRAVVNAAHDEHSDYYLRVRHEAPHTRSDTRFRGIGSGHARVSCTADVHATPAARGADIRQSLKGLNDNAGAGINLCPRLTIETDDIQAQHGATVGQFDPQWLFYLQARGIDVGQARQILKRAFLGDLLAGIEVPEVRAEAERLAGRALPELPAPVPAA